MHAVKKSWRGRALSGGVQAGSSDYGRPCGNTVSKGTETAQKASNPQNLINYGTVTLGGRR